MDINRQSEQIIDLKSYDAIQEESSFAKPTTGREMIGEEDTLGIVELQSSETCPAELQTQDLRDDVPTIIEEPEPNVLLNVDSSTSLNNPEFMNSFNPSSMHDMLPSDIREDLDKIKSNGTRPNKASMEEKAFIRVQDDI